MRSKEPNLAVQFHDRLAEQWEGKYARSTFSMRAHSLLTMPVAIPRSGELWLDAGCGTGTIARLLAQSGCRVTAVDGSARMIDIAKRIGIVAGFPAIDFLQVSDVVDLPFTAASFDAVVCSSVIEYVDSPIRVLRELSRVLRVGGKLVISVPNRRAVLRRLQKVVHRYSARCGLRPWPEYMPFSRHEYTAGQFRELLCSAGFEQRDLRYYGPGLPRVLTNNRYGGTLLMAACVRTTLPSGMACVTELRSGVSQ